MKVPINNELGADNYWYACKYCPAHFMIQGEKDIHESRCAAVAKDKHPTYTSGAY